MTERGARHERPRATHVDARERGTRVLNMSLEAALIQAARVVARVAAGRSLNAELERRTGQLEAAARGAVFDLCYGTLRRYGWVQAVQRALSRRGRDAGEVAALIWCGLYALECGRYAEYTVVDQAVRACGRLGRAAAGGYVNALLRAWLRERPRLESRLGAAPQARYWHPGWWIARLQRAYPSDWTRILEAGNSHPPMCLRVNLRRSSLPLYAAKLAAAGLASHQVGSAALILDKPLAVEGLPGFALGEVSVQDAGAQRAARYLDIAAGQRVLDACAGPGGKTVALLEAAGGPPDVTAVELEAQRLQRVEQNLSRCGRQARLVCADLLGKPDWWSGERFDAILLDAPCSGTGVIRRHPDIKLLRRERDIASLAHTQRRLLQRCLEMLRPGGRLLYCTCSVLPAENERLVAGLLSEFASLRLAPTPPAVSLPPQIRRLECGLQLLPGDAARSDGFYYACLTVA